MRLLAVVMSVAVVAGGVVWAQTQRSTPTPKTASAPAGVGSGSGSGVGVECDRQRGPVAGVGAGRRWRVGSGRRRGVRRAPGRAAGIERQRRRQHGGRRPCAPAGRQAVPAAGGARPRIRPAADRGESGGRSGHHRSPGHADPAKARPVHRHVSLVDADVADGRSRVDAGAERAASARRCRRRWRRSRSISRRTAAGTLPAAGRRCSARRWPRAASSRLRNKASPSMPPSCSVPRPTRCRRCRSPAAGVRAGTARRVAGGSGGSAAAAVPMASAAPVAAPAESAGVALYQRRRRWSS